MTPSLSLVNPYPEGQDVVQRIALAAFALGVLALVIAAFGPGGEFPQLFFWLAVVPIFTSDHERSTNS